MIIILLLSLTNCLQQTQRIKCLSYSLPDLCHSPCTRTFSDMRTLCHNYIRRSSKTLTPPSLFLTTSHPETSTTPEYNNQATSTILLGTLPPSLVEVQAAPVISLYPHNTTLNIVR